MNQKAFTLIELLATIILIAVVLLIAAPNVVSILNESDDSISETEDNVIKDISKNYYYENRGEIKLVDNMCVIRYNEDLINKGYMSGKEKDLEVFILVTATNLDVTFNIIDDRASYINCSN